MADKDDETKDKQNPFEELTKQFSEVLGKVGTNIQFATFPFNQPQPEEKVSKEEPILDEQEALKKIQGFNYKPREIKEYLDRFVISQDEAKKVLSVAICDHYNHVRNIVASKDNKRREYMKQNVLILGPTGVGKTYLVKTIARLIGVPFVKADATKFSETGYVGGDVEDLVRNLIKAANGNVELAQYGIIFIDEIDKITNGIEGGRDVSGRGVQINLLKLMEETEVNVLSQTDMLNQVRTLISFGNAKKQPEKISTQNILFIVSGAFDKLGQIIKRRVGAKQIGFNSEQNSEEHDYDYLQKAQTEDFIQYGFEPEFIGRLPVRVACRSLGEVELERILSNSEGSIMRQYREDFAGYGINLNFSGEALKSIAKQAVQEKTGARGLLTVLEHIFREMKFELPSTDIHSIYIDKIAVQDPKLFLGQLLENQEVENEKDTVASITRDLERFVQNFENNFGIRLKFTEKAEQLIIQKVKELGKSAVSICNKLFEDYGYGLELLFRESDEKQFEITEAAVESPETFLAEQVTNFYKNNVQ